MERKFEEEKLNLKEEFINEYVDTADIDILDRCKEAHAMIILKGYVSKLREKLNEYCDKRGKVDRHKIFVEFGL